ncbi:hypothetical protein [Nocardia wallacei]|uniref:hypothetical protein n=1 Tax=Nocardia wallacei TaxID=480035 RepID=UPI002458BBC3|nr:hypothetical protein [Nocardia wallacei]
MDPLAAVADLAAKLKVPENELDPAAATLALETASGLIRDRCGWPISQETVIAAALDGDGSPSLWLPTLHLTAVGPVVVDARELVVGTEYDWTSYGKLIRAGRWPCRPRSVTVTYTHGYDPVPAGAKGVCVKLAAAGYENPAAVVSRSENYGPFAESFKLASGGSLGAEDEQALGRYVLQDLG